MNNYGPSDSLVLEGSSAAIDSGDVVGPWEEKKVPPAILSDTIASVSETAADTRRRLNRARTRP